MYILNSGATLKPASPRERRDASCSWTASEPPPSTSADAISASRIVVVAMTVPDSLD